MCLSHDRAGGRTVHAVAGDDDEGGLHERGPSLVGWQSRHPVRLSVGAGGLVDRQILRPIVADWVIRPSRVTKNGGYAATRQRFAQIGASNAPPIARSITRMVTVLIPWRPQPSRLAAFAAVMLWYRENLPRVDIRTVDSADEIFTLARCRNDGISSIGDRDEVVVINDADTLPQLEPLLAAIAAAAQSGLVHLPYEEYRWLGARGTAQYAEGSDLDVCDFELVRGACSGIYVTTPATWWSHGGQDERFRGWGFEDAAWYVAHETLLGEAPRRTPGRVYALHHEAQVREGPQYDANATLMQGYRDAAETPERMRRFLLTAPIDVSASADPVPVDDVP